MTKEEYIEKYGIEAYNDHPSKRGKPVTVDKYTECTTKALQYLWKAIDVKLLEDFNITVKCEKDRIKERQYSILNLYIDENYIATITWSQIHSSFTLGRKNAYNYGHMDDMLVPRIGYKVFLKKFINKGTKADIEQLIEDDYLSDFFTAIIEVMNYITVIEPNIKAEYLELIAENEKDEDEDEDNINVFI